MRSIRVDFQQKYFRGGAVEGRSAHHAFEYPWRPCKHWVFDNTLSKEKRLREKNMKWTRLAYATASSSHRSTIPSSRLDASSHNLYSLPTISDAFN